MDPYWFHDELRIFFDFSPAYGLEVHQVMPSHRYRCIIRDIR
jgi:hypothetical protein